MPTSDLLAPPRKNKSQYIGKTINQHISAIVGPQYENVLEFYRTLEFYADVPTAGNKTPPYL
jgi:hypothetical protein